MAWTISLADAFEPEFARLDILVRQELLASARLLAEHGPMLGRPFADTLAGSKHANMKELRFSAADGQWRVAFAFDPVRRGILLVAGDKTGVSQRLFYKRLLDRADKRYDSHLAKLGTGQSR